MKYAVSCSKCNNPLTVEARHAGTSILCSSCNEPVEIPKLRELRLLEPVQDERRRAKRGWGPLSGCFFSVGLLLLAIALGAIGYLSMIQGDINQFTEAPDVEDLQFNMDIQEVTLNESWQVWKELQKRGDLSKRPKPTHQLAQSELKRLNIFLYIFAGVATVGLVFAVMSLLFRPLQA